ncbi:MULTISPECIES: SHOCT domain-containing protein [Halomonadaceae]|nr:MULTISPECIES: SHOCT domain-containing protein [Halomonas]MCD6007765.1 SHOCT domain-containing protein [Halomonas sp. IOP_31]
MPGACGANDEIFAALERLGDLKAGGILSEEAFTAKKAELLSRL